MGAIRVLEPNVANQIAAGEVIERPASVVKELVENALDAGASRVEVVVDGGGVERILVTDDGSGLGREDAVMAFERHATSKIRSAADLASIQSYGFRGEALPSIASVSRVVLTTSAGEPQGTRVRLSAGRVLAVEPAAHPRGATVSVEGLFFNAPARRKFLRAPATETTRIASILARMAAVVPGIAFSLKSGGRVLASWPAAADYRERVAQIVGHRDAAMMLEVDRRTGPLRVSGLASAPSLSRSTSTDQHLFVNGRPIRDRRILHAVQQAYATLLPRGRYPVVYLFLAIPAGQVDVNVHPAKAEVRFVRPREVHDLVRQALLGTLGVARPFYGLAAGATAVAEPAPAERLPPAGSPRTGPPAGVVADGAFHAGSLSQEPAGDPDSGPERRLFEGVALAPLAQFRDTYILASAPDGLVILDQHAAHERVLYERFLAESRSGGLLTQKLLFPITVDVTPAERLAFDECHESLGAFGFSIAPFGENTLVVDEIPSLVPDGAVERLVRQLLAEVMEWRPTDGMDQLRHRIVATAACHAAVRARHPLDVPRMRAIVDDLLGTSLPMTCPHGRPVLLRLTIDRLEKEFRRT